MEIPLKGQARRPGRHRLGHPSGGMATVCLLFVLCAFNCVVRSKLFQPASKDGLEGRGMVLMAHYCLLGWSRRGEACDKIRALR